MAKKILPFGLWMWSIEWNHRRHWNPQTKSSKQISYLNSSDGSNTILSNIERTRTPYFWLQTIEHRTLNIVRPITKQHWTLLNYSSILRLTCVNQHLYSRTRPMSRMSLPNNKSCRRLAPFVLICMCLILNIQIQFVKWL